ncbi:hypothetical protein QLQ15_04870 [Lysobacter sp. LF1]|uniref:Uncharacterized protein n=1 Tax=Lysobacter stagni TaxID=3045172 RepID=A0ABT6XDM1_9GAMM|nr:hypothetical protein [Lysobacter sp. LF1]MDI9238242.1 hypothetical protein [Lysobacter sp. LF1]
MFYVTVVVGALVLFWAGVMGSFLWFGPRRWRAEEQWLRSRRAAFVPEPNPDSVDEAPQREMPIHRRPFHEALWEDEPSLAPSPRVRALVREVAARQQWLTDEAGLHEENGEMKWKHAVATAALTAGVVSGCQTKQPEIQRNPHPQERYEITMTIRDAPGPFRDIGGSVQYDVENWVDCMPEKWTFERGHYHDQPDEFLPLTYTRIAENVYRTQITVDALQDEDYHGLGVCEWKMTVVTSRLYGMSVRFTPRLHLEDLRAQQPKKVYFSKRTYLSTKLDDFPNSGKSSPSGFGAEVQDELFTITLTPRRIWP